jgi:putative serine protease PepD
VTPDGPAAKAGLRGGDVLTAVGGRAVTLPSEARAAAFLARPGQAIRVRYRRNGAEAATEITLAP